MYKAKLQATADGKDISGTYNRAENGSARFILKPRRSRFGGQSSDVGSQTSDSRLMPVFKDLRYENGKRAHITRSLGGVADYIS
jgi:hypothetical protein